MSLKISAGMALCTLAGSVLMIGSANATPIANGGTVVVTTTGAITGSQVGSTTTAAVLDSHSVQVGDILENEYQQVNGSYTFTYQLQELASYVASEPPAIDSLTVSNFTGYLTDVEYTGTSTPGTIMAAENSGYIDFTGFTVTQNGTSGTGTSVLDNSQVLVVNTNASGGTKNVGAQAHDGDYYNASGLLGPSGPIAPEPASIAVFGFAGIGLLGLVLRARRKGVAPMAA